jgi:hypothetical protein
MNGGLYQGMYRAEMDNSISTSETHENFNGYSAFGWGGRQGRTGREQKADNGL